MIMLYGEVPLGRLWAWDMSWARRGERFDREVGAGEVGGREGVG